MATKATPTTKATETTTEAENAILAKIMKRQKQQSIPKKDFSIKQLFEIGGLVKPYQQDDGSVILEVTSMTCTYVPKYDKDDNPGYATTLYLSDGKVTGAFSGALLNFFEFMLSLGGNAERVPFRMIDLKGKNLKIRITKIPLDEGHTTYNFEIVGGTIGENVAMIGGAGSSALLAIGDAD